jgi:hypothetical protein
MKHSQRISLILVLSMSLMLVVSGNAKHVGLESVARVEGWTGRPSLLRSLATKRDASGEGRIASQHTAMSASSSGCNGASFAQAAGSPVSAGSEPVSVAIGDFNLDGKLDLAVSNNGSNNVTILLGDGSGGFTQAAGSPIGTGTKPQSVAVGDFNLDGKPDIAVANYGSFPGPSSVTILLGDGSGGFTQPAGSPFGAGSESQSISIGDFNLDGKLDLAVANGASNNVTILLGDGSGGFTQPAGSPVGAGSYPRSVSVGDFNLDGKPDLAVANQFSNNVTILLGNGSGGFTGSSVPATGQAFFIAVGDFNLDGKPDLARLSQSNVTGGGVTILLGDGNGAFTQPPGSPFSTVGSDPHSLAIGDFNMDGRPDLAVANEASDNVTILLGDGSGGFILAGSPIAVGDNPSSVAVGDFNLDGTPDLAVSNVIPNDVTILLNTCSACTQPPTITCPGNISIAAGASCPVATSAQANFTVTTSDDCSTVTSVCNPPSGSSFPVGTTTVTCTATNVSGTTGQCTFTVTVSSFCLQDETSPGNVVLVNASTGDFSFCCGGVPVAGGRGTLTTRGCIGSIDATKGDRQVHIRWDTSSNNDVGAGTAIVQKLSNKTVCQITDKNMFNNTCQCSSAPPPASPNPIGVRRIAFSP